MQTRFTGDQIIAMIKEQKAGEKTADVCRRYGIRLATFYKYKSKGNPPFSEGPVSRIQAAFDFCIGVIPPMPMFGLSLL